MRRPAGTEGRTSSPWRWISSFERLCVGTARHPPPVCADALAVGAQSIVVVVNPAAAWSRSAATTSSTSFSAVSASSRREFGAAHRFAAGALAREEFYRLLVGKNPSEINTYWSRLIFSGKTRPPIQAGRVEDALSMAQGSAGAITYLERGKVSGRLKIVFELSP